MIHDNVDLNVKETKNKNSKDECDLNDSELCRDESDGNVYVWMWQMQSEWVWCSLRPGWKQLE